MEKPAPAAPTCPICKGTAVYVRPINAQVEFWECENKHMFVVDTKIPKATPAASAAAASPSPPED